VSMSEEDEIDTYAVIAMTLLLLFAAVAAI
jgi:hypothetical protein